MRLVVVNHAHSNICGIHDLGRRIAARLDRATGGDVIYVEAAHAAHIPDGDVVLFNYRADLTPWVQAALPSMGGVKAAILHNYDVGTLNERAAELLAVGFDRVVVLDPDVKPADPRVVVTGRFLPNRVDGVTLPEDHLRVGSFGFAFPHKRFDLVAGAVRELGLPLGAVTFRLHTPEAYFNGASGGPLYAEGIGAACSAVIPTQLLEHTTDHRSDGEVVEWLAGNHVNCLLYTPGQPDGGLSSALDYLLAARRPILVSDAAMFRHGRDAVARWPATSLWSVVQNMRTWEHRVAALAGHFDMTAAGQLIDALGAGGEVVGVGGDGVTDWKQKHADEADKVLENQFVIDAMNEFADNMGFELAGLPAYGLAKVAHYAATVARAQALGFDPELLRLTASEANSLLLERAAQAVMLGIPVHLLEGDEP